jgi:hypothetical protein
MDASGWIKNCTAKISNAIGGGSELFTRQGEEYRLDVDFVCRRISEMRERQHNAMHKAVKAERALAAKDAELSRLREAMEALSKEADRAYCQSLDQFQKPECLGWAAKAHAGKFGNDEHLGHKRANELMGRHQGIVHALKVIRAALNGGSDAP